MKAYVETRTQPAKGTWPKQGPDTYVAVQVVPDDTPPLTVLNHQVAGKRGIEIIYVGEGYRTRYGPTSMLGQALAKAKRLADEINKGD